MTEMQDLQKMLQELLDAEEGLMNREIEFLDSLNQWEGQFTPKQTAWLKRIWNKIFA